MFESIAFSLCTSLLPSPRLGFKLILFHLPESCLTFSPHSNLYELRVTNPTTQSNAPRSPTPILTLTPIRPLASALASYHLHHLYATQQLLELGLGSLSADVVDEFPPVVILPPVFKGSGQP